MIVGTSQSAVTTSPVPKKRSGSVHRPGRAMSRMIAMATMSAITVCCIPSAIDASAPAAYGAQRCRAAPHGVPGPPPGGGDGDENKHAPQGHRADKRPLGQKELEIKDRRANEKRGQQAA